MPNEVQPVFPLAPFDSQAVPYTEWPSRSQPANGVVHHGVAHLLGMLERHSGIVLSKEALPLYSLITVREGYRNGAHLECIYGLGFDCDSGQDPAPLLNALREAGICFIFNESTHSEFVCQDNPTGCGRWRLLLFISRPMTAVECGFDAERASRCQQQEYNQFKRLRGHVADRLCELAGLPSDTFDAATSNPVSGWFPGARPSEEVPARAVRRNPGLALDIDAIMADLPLEPVRGRPRRSCERPNPAPAYHEPVDQGDYEVLVQSLAAAWPTVPGCRHDAAFALAHLLLRGGVPPDRVPALVAEIALRAGDEEGGNRRAAAEAALADQRGYGWIWLHEHTPELYDALKECDLLQFPLPPRLEEDLEPTEDWAPVPVEVCRADMATDLGRLDAATALGLGCPSGTGKTSAMRRGAEARHACGQRTAIAVPRYDVLWNEVVGPLRGEGVPVKVLLSITSKNERGEFYCIHHEAAGRLAGAGYDAKRILCGRCDQRSNCPANRGYVGDDDALIVVGTHPMLPALLEAVGPDGHVYIDERLDDWLSKELTQHQLTAAWFAAEACLDRQMPEYAVVMSALDDVRDWAALNSAPGQPGVTLASIIGLEQAAALAAISLKTLNPNFREYGNMNRAVALGSMLKPLIAAATDEDVRIERMDARYAENLGVVISGPDPTVKNLLRTMSQPVAMCNANLEPGDFERISGREMRVVRFQVDDTSEVDRVLIPWSNGSRRSLLRGRRRQTIRMDLIVHPLSVALDRVEAWPGASGTRRVVLASFKVVAEVLRCLLDGTRRPANNLELRVRDRISTFLDNAPPGEERRLEVVHYGAVAGLNSYEDFGVCITLGDPWQNLTDVRRRSEYFEVPFDTRYRQEVRKELYQVHGRLRNIGRSKPALCIHLGYVAPLEWTRDIVDVLPLRAVRPRVTVSMTREERRAAGISQREAAARDGVSTRTIKRREKSGR